MLSKAVALVLRGRTQILRRNLNWGAAVMLPQGSWSRDPRWMVSRIFHLTGISCSRIPGTSRGSIINLGRWMGSQSKAPARLRGTWFWGDQGLWHSGGTSDVALAYQTYAAAQSPLFHTLQKFLDLESLCSPWLFEQLVLIQYMTAASHISNLQGRWNKENPPQ